MTTVSIIGGGFIGLKHAAAISEVPGLQLAGVATRTSSSLEAFRQRFDVPGSTNARDEINRPDVDAVLIATPHHLHTDLTIEAIEAGKRVLLEKPMAHTAQECEQIVQAVLEADSDLMVGFTYRFAPHYVSAKQFIDEGLIGVPRAATTSVTKPWWAPNRRGWHEDRSTGGGMWLVAGIHGVDRTAWLLGVPATEVSAYQGTLFHDMPADDVTLARFTYENDAVANVSSIGFATGPSRHVTEIYGSDGKIICDDSEGIVLVTDDEHRSVPLDENKPWIDQALVNQWTAFENWATGGANPIGTMEAWRTMAAVFAAEESASRGGAMQSVKSRPW